MGDNFEKITEFVWPFKLTSSRGNYTFQTEEAIHPGRRVGVQGGPYQRLYDQDDLIDVCLMLSYTYLTDSELDLL